MAVLINVINVITVVQLLLATLAVVLAFNAYRIQDEYDKHYKDVSRLVEIDDEMLDIHGFLTMKNKIIVLSACVVVCIICMVLVQCAS